MIWLLAGVVLLLLCVAYAVILVAVNSPDRGRE